MTERAIKMRKRLHDVQKKKKKKFLGTWLHESLFTCAAARIICAYRFLLPYTGARKSLRVRTHVFKRATDVNVTLRQETDVRRDGGGCWDGVEGGVGLFKII